MKTNLFLFAALTAAFLNVANYAAAQVTIGGGDAPKAGAVLDLNSTTKGGLALSNVNLTDLNTIPIGFPGIKKAEDVTDEVKAKLTGALVYNINSDICLGVYVWDGNCWKKICKDYQVKAAGSGELKVPSIIENENVILAGEAVTLKFTAPEGVQFYNWYEDNTYLATTTDPEYTASFPIGSHTMKVMLDNCQSLSESMVTFNASKVYPASLPATGGLIHILSAGLFPYAATSEYVQTGLVAHYDGINNQKLGDNQHSSNAVEWKDLTVNGYDVKLRKGHSGSSRIAAVAIANVTQCSGARWDRNGFLFNDFCYFANVPNNPSDENALSTIMPELPYENDNFTLESVFDPTLRSTKNGGIAGWGTQEVCRANSVRFYEMTDNAQPQFRNLWWTGDVSVKFTDNPGSINIKNLAITYDNALTNNENRTFYYNGVPAGSSAYFDPNCISTTNQCREKTNKNTAKRGSFFVGQSVGVNTDDNAPANDPYVYPENQERYSNGNKIFSVRVYKKALTPEEVAANYAVDKLRFAATPIVKIGNVPCENVVVHSTRLITCQAPAGTAGTVNVEVISGEDASQILLLENEFTYQ